MLVALCVGAVVVRQLTVHRARQTLDISGPIHEDGSNGLGEQGAGGSEFVLGTSFRDCGDVSVTRSFADSFALTQSCAIGASAASPPSS